MQPLLKAVMAMIVLTIFPMIYIPLREIGPDRETSHRVFVFLTSVYNTSDPCEKLALHEALDITECELVKCRALPSPIKALLGFSIDFGLMIIYVLEDIFRAFIELLGVFHKIAFTDHHLWGAVITLILLEVYTTAVSEQTALRDALFRIESSVTHPVRFLELRRPPEPEEV